MKTKLLTRWTPLIGLILLSTIIYQPSTSYAQGTAFTYQGRVQDNGTNFTGTGQFKFALVTSSDANHTATATANISGGFVTTYGVTSGGNGYTTAPAVTVFGGGGSGATAHANISGGTVTSVIADNPGSGYSSVPAVLIAPPPPNLSYTTYWSNDGTSSAGSEPSAAVSVSVANGLFTVVLGDSTLANMTAISALLFAQPNLQLRIWFNDGVNGFAVLSPVQNLTPTPYAIRAGTAASVAIPPGMALIPAGAFTMGNSIGDGDITDATPISTMVSAFYMDVNLVSWSQWQSVYFWATNHGYGFVNVGSGKAANHPVQTVDWYDTVKWCNARSQQAGRTPVYYTDAGLTQIYTNGEVATLYPNWAASGYRLPTEAEWEKAARGGLSGQRFPWGNVINQNLANYYGCISGCGFTYDLGPNGNNVAFTNGVTPYTSPVGYFAPNGYGLYDMAGNVFEWCWDWYGTPYAGGSDPRGPASGMYRALRGGSEFSSAADARCAIRGAYNPTFGDYYVGFRCVRGL